MLKPIIISSEIVDEYLLANDYTSLSNYLKNVFKLQKREDESIIRYEYSSDVLHILNKVLSIAIDDLKRQNHQELLKDIFRSLRNYVITPDVQNHLINDDNFLEKVRIVLNSALTLETLQMILQFLINLLISNKSAGLKVHNKFGDKIFFFLKEKKQIYETSALLYNVALYKDLNLDKDNYSLIFDLYKENPNVEFLHFLIEKFITYDDFWNYYQNFDVYKRLTVLEIIRQKQIKGNFQNLSEQGIKTFCKMFVNSGSIIFQTISSNDTHLEPYEVSQLLEVISSLCVCEKFLKVLQNDKDLLINCGILLINIHRLGRESENYFSSIQSLSELRKPTNEINEHPAFGFKANLIRIIGNLCWKNRAIQDLTREAELIPIILDCCNMDARNPFILQWAILAVRNLCENNIENQKIIAGLHQQGTVNSTLLEDFGLTLHSGDDSTIKIVPLEVIQNKKQ